MRRIPVTITHDLLAANAGSQALCLADDARLIGATYLLSATRPAGYMLHGHGLRPRAVHLTRADIGDGDGPDSDDGPPSNEADYSTAAATVAVVSVEGPLEEVSGAREPCGAWLMGYDTIAESYCAAHAAPAVDALLMRFRSPGGMVAGVFSCAARCEAAKATSGKMVVGFIDEEADSAAYLLASALCDVILIPEAGFAGSIGARQGMYNRSGALAKEGISYQAWGWPPKADGDDISGKLAGHPDLPPTAMGDARTAAIVNDAGQMFGALVDRTRGARGLNMAAILALKADTLRGPAAVAAHFADDIGTRESAMALAMSHAVARRMSATPAPMGAPSPNPAPVPAAHAARTLTGDPSMSLARLAALAGLAPDANASAIEAALMPLVTLGRAAMVAAGTNDAEAALGRTRAAFSDAAEVPALRKSAADMKARAEMSDRREMIAEAVAQDRLTPAQAYDVSTAKDAAGGDVIGPDGKAVVARTLKARWLAPSLDAKGREVGCTLGNLAAELESRAVGASGGKTATPFDPDPEKARKQAEAAGGGGGAQVTEQTRQLARRIGADPAKLAESQARTDRMLNKLGPNGATINTNGGGS